MPANEPWYRTSRRWGQTNLVEIDPERYDDAWWRRYWRDTRIDGVIVNAGGIVAYYPSEFELHHRAVGISEQNDLYGRIVASARDEGLAVVARMDSNRVAEDFFIAHPEWMARDADGEPYRAADKWITCVNSGYYNDYLLQVLAEITRRSAPDGFADNSWAGLPRDRICYCENCARIFREAKGSPLPAQIDWSDPTYRDWVRWNYDRRVEIWELNNKATQAAGGEHCIWMGMLSGDQKHAANRFNDQRRILVAPRAADDRLAGEPPGSPLVVEPVRSMLLIAAEHPHPDAVLAAGCLVPCCSTPRSLLAGRSSSAPSRGR
ncbi:beta-galactosidase [Ruania alba]|uniref:Hypothetical glycosyl hydrolase 6 n=1 Tax=Ruania alba TaxID=648782 RepID=A0A1H5K9H8_9MICO|nr:beta-galactosidase [Ruania alba]SEE60708.1 Hypothetical glycosyl hydrolase 6 [Ruania alba]